MFLIIYLAIHIIFGILTYGYTFAYFQGEYPILAYKDYKNDKTDAFCFAVWGVGGFLGMVFYGLIAKKNVFKHGMKFR